MNPSLKLLIALKNASLARKEKVIVQKPTKSIVNLLSILYTEGLVQSFLLNETTQELSISLRYSYNKDAFKNLKVFAKTTTLSYFNYNDICKLSNKRFLLVFSTNRGFLTSLECKKQHLGGKLCFIC